MGTGTPLPLEPHEMEQTRREIRGFFPKLDESFQVTSYPTDDYNCIGWAANDQENWWWPDPDGEGFWPSSVAREEKIDSFIAAFRTLGYEPCLSSRLQAGYEKVAIYALNGVPKHMARQMPSGEWSSKLGEWWDIGHSKIGEIETSDYGAPVKFMRRRTSARISLFTHVSEIIKAFWFEVARRIRGG